MVERGYIKNVQEAFNGYLDDGGIAYISRPRISAQQSIEMIHSVGGVAVLAHPLYAKNHEKVLSLLAEFGLVGFEVHYGDFTPSNRSSLFRLAEKLGMLPCGGSDYHAFGKEGESLPGSVGPPIEVAIELKRKAEARSQNL
jgi:predicted metal-dependent phosphoesterase TrpH